MNGSDSQASYTLGFELGRALILEARHQLIERAPAPTTAADTARALTVTSRYIRRLRWRSRREIAHATLHGDRDTAAWWSGHMEGACSVLR